MKAWVSGVQGASPRLEEVPALHCDPGKVLVEIAACSLNFADLLMIKGTYQEQPRFPLTPGMEISGRVVAVGSGGPQTLIGQPVAAVVGSGGLARRCVVDIPRIVPLDAAADLVDSAALPIAYGTSHLALSRTARLTEGEILLVTGASGGVGLTAVELGRRMGARVVACVRGPAKMEIARKAGAHLVIDTNQDSVAEIVRDFGGADVVYDTVGGPEFKDLVRATNPEGRIILIGFASGELPQIKPNHLLVKNVSVHGFYWGGFLTFRPEVHSESLSQIFRWHRDGTIKPTISRTFPFERADDALDHLKSRKATGKIVVTTDALP